jgi:hypothetical protein
VALKRPSLCPDTRIMLIPAFLTAGSLALLIGTGLQLAAWSYRSVDRKQPVKVRHVLAWMFDSDAFQNDQAGERRKALRQRALRRTRTGWVWLFIGAFATFIASFIDLVRSIG